MYAALFGVMCAATGALPLFTRAATRQFEIATLDGEQAFRVRPSAARKRLLFLICVALALLAQALAGSSDGLEKVIGWTGVLFFGGGSLLLAFGRQEQLAITPRGIRARAALRDTFVEWDDIADLGLMTIRGTTFITVRLKTPPRSWLGRFNHRWFGVDVSVSTSGVAIEPRRLVAALSLYAQVRSERARIGTSSGLERLEAVLPVP